ncbi:hypothetical protein D3C71_1635730 [compost metagenome]
MARMFGSFPRSGLLQPRIASRNSASAFATAIAWVAGVSDLLTDLALSILSSELRDTTAFIPVSMFSKGVPWNALAASRASAKFDAWRCGAAASSARLKLGPGSGAAAPAPRSTN